jgi:hypothetical protein
VDLEAYQNLKRVGSVKQGLENSNAPDYF